MAEPMVLCPVCRTAIPDREYYRHAKQHQPPRPVTARLNDEGEKA